MKSKKFYSTEIKWVQLPQIQSFKPPPPSAPLLELAEDKDVRQLLEVGRQLFSNSNITVRIDILHIILIYEILYQFVELKWKTNIDW